MRSNGLHNNQLTSIILFLFLASLIDYIQVVRCQSANSFESGRLNTLTDDNTNNNPDGSITAPNASSSLVWQPLRATFRPLNRSPPPSLAPATPPEPPAALVSSASDLSGESLAPTGRFSNQPASSSSFSTNSADRNSFFVPIITTTSASASPTTTSTTITTTSTTQAPFINNVTPSSLDDEDLPTRVPLSRFRPTKPPSVDAQSQPASNLFANFQGGNQPFVNNTAYRITNECFECICEASTSCNSNSRCQTSDVRHTRCGMFLISYDQWLETGLSRQLVNQEALARDAAADERAFYECVTKRDCSERLMSIYMQRRARDCDKDGRIDCYDVAAIHQGGVDQCNSEGLLESQYWSDFNACFGFGRR